MFGRWSDAHVGIGLLRSGDDYRREEPELESEKSVALQVDFLYIPRLGGVRRDCLLYTSPSPRDRTRSRMPSSA